MNASRLRELVDLLLNLENEFQIQNKLNELSSNLASIVQQPQQPQFQNQFANTLTALTTAEISLREKIEPAQISLLNEIGASKFFVGDLTSKIKDWMHENPHTPAVTQTNLNNFNTERQNYLNNITRLRDSLDAIGVKASSLEPGGAEIGFLLPRSLFDNNFEELIDELAEIDFILRAFSELATGSVELMEVRQISTTDPIFFLAMGYVTITMIAQAVTWALDTWERVQKIRKLRLEASNSQMFSEKEIDSIFGKKCQEIVEKAVTDKLDTLSAYIKSETGRKMEQIEHLKKVLYSLLARIERGMIVQVRYLKPPESVQEEGKPPDIPKEFKELKEITPRLIFPVMEGKPILQLPSIRGKIQNEE